MDRNIRMLTPNNPRNITVEEILEALMTFPPDEMSMVIDAVVQIKAAAEALARGEEPPTGRIIRAQ